MFSKIFKSAKTALQPADKTVAQPEAQPSTPARSMVNTRGRARAALEAEEITTPSAQILASSRKRQLRNVTSTPAASQEIVEVDEPETSIKKRKLTAPSMSSTRTRSQIEVRIPAKEVIDLESGEEEEKTTVQTPKRGRPSKAKAETVVKSQRKSLATAKSPAKESTISLISDEEEELKIKASSQQISLLSDDEEEPKVAGKSHPVVSNEEEVTRAALQQISDEQAAQSKSSSQKIHDLVSDDEVEEEKSSQQKVQNLVSDDEVEEEKSSQQKVQNLVSDDEVEQPKPSSQKKPSTASQPKMPKMNKPVENLSNTKKSESPKINQKSTKAAEAMELPKPKHRRFGSEEPVAEIPSSDPNDNNDIEESEEESSDDEAPEEVGTREAGEDAKKVARAAAKAVEEKKAAERKVKQERALALKKQAEINKKRKRTEEAAPEVESEDGDAPSFVPGEQTETNDVTMEDAPETTPPQTATKIPKIDRDNLPDLLPLEYLEEDNTAGELATTLNSLPSRPKKTKFTDLVEKKAKDKKKGSTTFRVREAKQDARLAPKASKAAMSLKEAWLSGGVGKSGKGKGGSVRKPMRSSFLVGGKSGAGKR